MIVWTKKFSKRKKPLGYLRLLLSRYRYFDRMGAIVDKKRGLRLKKIRGYRWQLRQLFNIHRGKRCFIIGNGPSLKKMDLSPLRKEILIGSNGIYKAFTEWGFTTNYLLFEDVEQTELRGHEIFNINGPLKMASLYNAYAFRADKNTLFFNARGADNSYWEEGPFFSNDFAHIVYLGSTVTYICLQLAYYLGCNPVYLIGVDHNYGKLPQYFPPGKIVITRENIDLVRGLHFNDRYYKIGDQIGVPNVEYQEKAYAKARETFESSGRSIYNAGLESKLDIFKRESIETLFKA